MGVVRAGLSPLAEARSTGGLLIAEIFGPTIQGEGPSAGRPATFVRLSECNLHCVWCDTAYTWDWRQYDRAKEQRIESVEDVAQTVLAKGAPILVISGGEPLMQAEAVGHLIERIKKARRIKVEVETNGTFAPAMVALPNRFNVSIKLSGNGADSQRVRIRPHAIEALRETGRAVWKFVVSANQAQEIAEVERIVAQFRLPPGRVWLMPEGTYPGRIHLGLQRLVEPCVEHGWNLSPRLQVMIWGAARGR